MEGSAEADQAAGALTHNQVPGEHLPHAHNAAAQASLAQLIRAPSGQPGVLPRQDAGPAANPLVRVAACHCNLHQG